MPVVANCIRCGILTAVLLGIATTARAEELPPYRIDIGAPEDDAYIVDGFYQREGPNQASKLTFVQTRTFRWAASRFQLRLPVFPGRHNRISFAMNLRVALRMNVGKWEAKIFGRGWQEDYAVTVPASVVGDATELVLTGTALHPRPPVVGAETRDLVALITDITVQPVAELDPQAEEEDLLKTCADIPTLDRLRGIERRPVTSDPELFVDMLLAERANVVTMGAMLGTGAVFYPSKVATAHPGMEPQWIPEVTKRLREKGVKILCWVVFNIQDVRKPEDFLPAREHPEWQMRFIDEPGKAWPPRAGMCLLSSPYIEHHASVLREIAAFDFDGFFFDGFYLGGIPHPSRPGCVCEYCRTAFKDDTGLDLPEKVDWESRTFKRWVRWRNERLLKTARYLQAEMQKVNPRITCTFNYNMWPFARKDWETAIPAWRVDDFGVSQHGYTGAFPQKWLMTGFKARIGRDINPAHTDMWRAAALTHTCGPKRRDMAWHEQEMTLFLLAGLSHGITPWHSTIEGPIELTARVHAEAAKRERYFSRDYVANVGVLYSQNTHDFYGHIPETQNLGIYQDGILGTWMILSENHVPFEFVFDNQLEDGRFASYTTLLLPNSAALSQPALNRIAAWVRDGGILVATADTATLDEWGERAPEPRLRAALGIDIRDRAQSWSQSVAKGKVTFLPMDPGLAYCRQRDKGLADTLVAALSEAPLPFTVQAPHTLVVNMFRGKTPGEFWVHLLNVSSFMPNGDSGFRGLDVAPVKIEDTASDAQQEQKSDQAGTRNVPATNVVFRIPDRSIKSARLAVAGVALEPTPTGEIVIPRIDLHDVLVLEF